VNEELVARLREAAEAFNAGDPEPFVALLDPQLEWRGITRGHLWWRRTPS
jgi:hypothetical protein